MSSDRATPFPQVDVYGHGGLGPPPRLASFFPDEGAGAIIRERGCELVLHFASTEPDAPLLALRLGPDRRGERLEPSKAREFVPQIDLYMATARAALSWNADDFRAAAEALREIGRPGRGFSPDFSRLIATHYKALVAEGEKYPVKALADYYHVTISAASRWVTEARRRGYLPQKEAKDAR